MSGIVGLYYLDGRPIEQSELEKMTNILAHRGTDDARIWYQGSVGLGHRMLWTTPESLYEKLPLVSQRGDLVITADARIDNREELIPLLGFSGRTAGEITDSQLILAAYEKWGEHCPEKLMGDFAFVIWDERQQILFCARDHFGIKPLYYYHSDRFFVFGSEIKALLALSTVPRRLNELKVGYHLALTVEDKAITFYQNIFRLLPAHSMRVSWQGVRLRNYWSLDPSREIRLSSDEAYAEAFREIFVAAVRSHLRSAYPIGSMFSGGLDSAAVTCVAGDLRLERGEHPLSTFSAIYSQTVESDEQKYIHTVIGQGNLSPYYVDIDQLRPLENLTKAFYHLDEPFAVPTFYIVWALYELASKHGIRILLDGIDGDTAVYHGDGLLAELARAGQWQTFLAEAQAIAQHENLPPASLLFKQYGQPYFTELAQNWQWMTFAREVNSLAKQTGVRRSKMWRNYGLKPLVPGLVQRTWRKLRGKNGMVKSIIDQDFADRIDLEAHLKDLRSDLERIPKTARQEHYTLLTSGLQPYGFELTDKISMAFNIESRHPFADRRLLEFSLALPPEQKLSQGWSRIILRRAIAGIVPEEIRWRGGKARNSAAVTRGLLSFEKDLIGEMVARRPNPLEGYVNIQVLQAASERYFSHQALSDEMAVWQALNLALWLQHNNLN